MTICHSYRRKILMYRFKKILVTGGAGCIGIQVCNQLVNRGQKVVLFDLYEQINTVKKFLDKNNLKKTLFFVLAQFDS